VKLHEPTRTPTPIPVRTDPGLRFAWAHAVLIMVLLLAGAVHLGTPVTEGLAVLAMVVVAAGLPVLLRPVLGVMAWAFVTGFVVNELGQLTFTGADLLRLATMVTAVGLLPTPVRRLRR
jgi:hypothetical protein